MQRTKAISCLTALLAGIGLASCSTSDDSVVAVDYIDNPDAAWRSAPPLSPAARALQAATAEGLVGLDEQGRVVPALAQRWIVTDDGLSHIFRLREGTWPDGTPLTGELAAASLREALARLRGTALAPEAANIETIVARTGRVVELQSRNANPDMLRFLAQPELGLIRKGKGSGPLGLQRVGHAAILKPLPRKSPGLANPVDGENTLRAVRLVPASAKVAVANFRDGDVEVVLGGTWLDLPLARQVGLGEGVLRFDAVSGLFGLVVANRQGFLSEPGNREALAMAVDRDAIADMLGTREWKASNRLVTPGMEDDTGTIVERWVENDINARRAAGAARIARWRAVHGQPVLRLSLPDGPAATALFDRLSADFGAIGVRLRHATNKQDTDLRLLDEVARFPRATWFLVQLSCPVRPAACDGDADRLLASARQVPDGPARAALLAEAEAQLTRANTFIPFGPPLRWTLARRTTTGIMPNRWGVHPLTALARIAE